LAFTSRTHWTKLCFFVGEFFNAPLGNVYAEDEDDWDVENKTFAFVDKEHKRFFRYKHSHYWHSVWQ